MNIVELAAKNSEPFGRDWVEEMRQEIGVDLMGVLAVDEYSHPAFLYGVQALLPTAKAAVIFGMEYDSEVMNLIKHPSKYAGKVKTGEMLAPHVNQLNIEIDQCVSDLSRILKKQGYRSLSIPARGQPLHPSGVKATLSYAHMAEAAGMGTIGTHSLLITPEFGTRTRLTCLLTEAPLQTTKRVDPIDDCTHCLDCVKICPVQAISIPGPGKRYDVDGMRCKFYRDRVDNCGLCQKICSYSTGHSEAKDGPLSADEEFWNSVSAFRNSGVE